MGSSEVNDRSIKRARAVVIVAITAVKIDGLLKNSLAQIELRALAAASQKYPTPGSVAEENPTQTEEANPADCDHDRVGRRCLLRFVPNG